MKTYPLFAVIVWLCATAGLWTLFWPRTLPIPTKRWQGLALLAVGIAVGWYLSSGWWGW